MVGDLLDVAFYFVGDKPHVTGLNWRLMLGSAGIPALIVCCQVLFAPESPRWLIGNGRYQEAFKELCRLRLSKVQAARDLYYIHVLLEAEAELKKGRNRVVEMFTIPRNRNAALASWIVMFGQQFCGVNVIGMSSVVHSCRRRLPLDGNSVLLLYRFQAIRLLSSLCTALFLRIRIN